MPIKNTKAKGSLNENHVKQFFEELGYNVTKAGASLGIFDLVCISEFSKTYYEYLPLREYTFQQVLLIQVKTNKLPLPDEMINIMSFINMPKNASKIIAVVKDGKRGTDIKKSIDIYNLTSNSSIKDIVFKANSRWSTAENN